MTGHIYIYIMQFLRGIIFVPINRRLVSGRENDTLEILSSGMVVVGGTHQSSIIKFKGPSLKVYFSKCSGYT